MTEQMSRQRAAQIRAAVEHLQGLDDLSPTEQKALDRGLALLGEADNTMAQYDSRYRGFQRGATVGLSDNIAGAFEALKNPSEMGDSYRRGQQSSLEKDQAAYVLDPEGFESGQTAGQIGVAGGTALMGPSLAGRSLLTQIGTGMTAGSALGFGQGYSDYELSGSPKGEMLNYTLVPTATGAVTGGAVYPLGKVVGALTRKGRSMARPGVGGFGRLPTRTASRAIQNTQDAGMDIARYLDDLSPEAMLADVPGDLQTRGQGLASIGGEGGTLLRREVTERGANAGQRIASDLDANITGPNAAFNQRRALAAERSGKLGPEYDAALTYRDPIDVSDTLTEMREAASKAGPDTAPVLSRYIADLEAKAGDDGIDAASLHWLRSDLSDAIDGTGGKRNVLLQRALDAVDEKLDAVPGYLDARTGYASNKAMERAIEEGQGALRGGRASALSPDELAEQFNKLSDAEKDAFRAGLRRDIAALMGTSRNDAASAWGEFAKNWNEEKLRVILGDQAEPIIKRLRSEAVFSQTRGRIDAGSKTSETQAARQDLADYRDPETGQRPGPVARSRRAISEASSDLVDALIYGPRRSKANADLGRILSAQGPERDAILQALLRDATIENRPSLAPQVMDRLTRALAGGFVGSQARN